MSLTDVASSSQALALSIPGLPFTIDNTLGAVLVGFAVSCVVYGILCTQGYVYYERYPEDKVFYKLLVAVILLLETADQVFIGHIVYFYTIVNFANIPAVLKANVTWSFIMQLLIGSIVGVIVKTAFGLRVWRFSKGNYWITGLILILTWGQLGLALAFTVESFGLASVFEVVRLRVLGTVALGVGVLTDVITAAALSFYLMKLRTGYHKSDTLVRNLIRYAINTGFLTSAVSVATLIMYNLMPNNLIFIGIYFTLSKMYAISFMATLNTRKIVRGRGTDRQGTTSASHYPGSNNPSSRQPREIQTNGTNLFHLGTRIVPSMSEMDMEWEYAHPSPGAKKEMEYPPMPSKVLGMKEQYREEDEEAAYGGYAGNGYPYPNDVYTGYPPQPQHSSRRPPPSTNDRRPQAL